MGRTFIRITSIVLALAALLPSSDVYAQKMYSLGGASILQTININDFKVVDHETLSPAMSDIAFHPDGTLYGVNENSIYKIDTTNGSSQVVKQLSTSLGWLVGMTITYDGIFYMSGLGGDKDYIITYDPATDEVVNLGSTGWRHWDLEFFNGLLYLSGGTDNNSEGFLISADISDPSQSKVIVDYGAQSYGMSSFNNICGGDFLISLTSKNLILLDPDGASFVSTAIDDPLYTFSSGATSRTSNLGSLPPLKINTVNIDISPCNDSESGAVEILITQGRPGVEYSIDGINYQTSPNFSNVPIGVYQAFIQDALGCTDMSDPFEIKVSSLAFTIESKPAHCGEQNGIIIPIATTTGDSIEFSLNGNQFFTDPEFQNLSAGNYTIVARTKSGCLDSAVVNIQELPKLDHQIETTPEHCEQEDGTLTVIATGGMEPYSYTLVALPLQSSPTFSALHASTYLVRVVDELGCISEKQADIEIAKKPYVDNIDIEEAHCGMPDGSAAVTAFPSNSGMLYALNGGPFTANFLFTNLEPGIYDLVLLDEFGCDTTTTFIIPAKDGPSIQSIEVTSDYCNSAAGTIAIEASSPSGNLTYSINNGPFTNTTIYAGLVKGDYTVTVRDEFGCDAIETIQVEEEPSPSIDAIDVLDATCNTSNGSISILQSTSNGSRYSLDNIDFQSSPDFTDLSPGQYTLYLIDDNGCVDSLPTSLIEIEQTIIEEIQTTNATCIGNDGMITIFSYKINTNVQYSIDGSTFQIDAIFTNLSDRAYTGYLIDENGCMDSMQVTIKGKDAVVLNKIEITSASCESSDGTILVQTEGKVELTLDHTTTYTTELIEGLPGGTYTVTLTNESQCTLDTIVKIDRANCNIYIPNAFSPNGDGVNETLAPFFDPGQFQLLQFQVFDRWGNNVFSCKQLCEWDGTDSGKSSPSGVYIYHLQIEDPNGEISNISGDVTLLR